MSSSRSGQWIPTPRPMICQFCCSAGDPCARRGYHCTGTETVLPSTNSTVSSSAVTRTFCARASRPPRIEEGIPFSQQLLLVFFHQLSQSADLRRAEPTAVLQADWAKPEFGFLCLTYDVYVRWFASVSREEEHPIWAIAENRRQSVHPDRQPYLAGCFQDEIEIPVEDVMGPIPVAMI